MRPASTLPWHITPPAGGKRRSRSCWNWSGATATGTSSRPASSSSNFSRLLGRQTSLPSWQDGSCHLSYFHEPKPVRPNLRPTAGNRADFPADRGAAATPRQVASEHLRAALSGDDRRCSLRQQDDRHYSAVGPLEPRQRAAGLPD